MKKIETTEIIDRPLADVFRFYAVEHVRNHPRWDPDIELWLDKPGPLAGWHTDPPAQQPQRHAGRRDDGGGGI